MTFKLRIIPAGVLAEIGLRAGRTPQRVLSSLPIAPLMPLKLSKYRVDRRLFM